MVEETTQTNRRSKMARPKPVNLWTVSDVLKWFRRVNSEYINYLELFSKVNSFTTACVVSNFQLMHLSYFSQHEITGRALLRINDSSLLRMGIENNRDREAIWREIVKQKLKTDIMEIRDMERIVNQHSMAKIAHTQKQERHFLVGICFGAMKAS